MKSKKGEISTESLVVLGILVLTMFVLFSIAADNLQLFKTKKDKLCTVTLMLGSISKVGGKPLISPECEHKNIDISKEVLESPEEMSALRESQNSFNKIKTSITGNKEFETYKSQYVVNEILNPKKSIVSNIMTRELKNCWDRVGQGTYNLFNDWEEFISDCSGEGEAAAKCPSDVSFLKEIYISSKSMNKVPAFCFLCSRITFSDEELKNINIQNFDTWLAFSQVPKEKYSYLQYLTTNTYQYNQGQSYLGKNKEGYQLDEPLAIVYVKERRYIAWEKAKSILATIGVGANDEFKDDKGEPTDSRQYTAIFNYKDLPDYCSYLIG
jgi:hypothetical protein